MRVAVLGCRGSTPATGPEFVRYGGDTSSLAVTRAGQARPGLVLDAGTGVSRLGDLLDGEPFRGAVLLTHLHWDHTHGLPFSPALDHEDAEVGPLPPRPGRPAGGAGPGDRPPHFPIAPDGLRGRWRFHGLDEGDHEIAGLRVTAREIPHKGGRTFGYRIEDGAAALAYLPDHAPGEPGSGPDGLGEITAGVAALCSAADLLVHDAQHLAAEWPPRAFLGHSSVEYAVDLARRMGAGRLVLFHHDPRRTDAELDGLGEQMAGSRVDTVVAVQGTTLQAG